MSEAKKATDHDEIRAWIEARGGIPSRVRGTGPGGILRVDFGEPEEDLEEIPWETFFEIFDSRELVFLHQDEVDGRTSRFNKFIDRSAADS